MDVAGTLYVANDHGHDVTIYPAGSNRPSLTLSSGLERPYSVAVDAAGTVYVGDFDGQVVEYPAGQTQPSLVIPQQQGPSHYGVPVNETIDANGNLFVSYWYFDSASVAEFAPGSTAPQFTGTNLVSRPAGLAFWVRLIYCRRPSVRCDTSAVERSEASREPACRFEGHYRPTRWYTVDTFNNVVAFCDGSVIIDAWLERAPKRAATAYLKETGR